MNEKSFSVVKKPQLPLLHIIPFLLITFFSETQSILWNSTDCEPQHCGNNKDLVIQYPFWIPGRQESYCGSPQFITTCKDNYPILKFSGDDYIILNVNYTENSVVLARPEVFDQNNNCPVPQSNFSIEGTPFTYGPSTADLYFFYNCSNPYRDSNYLIQCSSNYSDHAYSFAVFHTKTLDEFNESCQAPVNSPVSADNINELSHEDYTQVLKMGFVLKWDGDDCRNCSSSENHCGSDNGSFICFCKDNVGRKSCGGGGSNLGSKNVIGKIWRWMLVSLAIVPVFVLAYVRIKRRIVKGKENRRRDDIIQQLTFSNSFNYGDELERGIKDAPDVKIFSLKAILASTNNFSDKNKLGQGGYGPVYNGKLSDGREIAVKRLSKTSGQGFQEFKSELILISKLQHTNLVRLYGCCIHKEEKMLIYEFMPNKSLDFFLFGFEFISILTAQDKKEKIGWQIRFNIIEGVAQGLLYLHKYSRMKVIHRDLKVGNVLLDENMNPKIADFGMARIFKQNVTEAVTDRVVGTYGYMAPEYAMEGTFSIKSDVFSFGVLVLEIVSGRRNSSFYNSDRPLNLVGHAWELWKGHASFELKDETLVESFDVKQLLRVIHIGLLCVQENADDRPTMSDVVYMLRNENIDLPSPKRPAFFIGRQTDAFHLNETRSTDYLLDRPIPISENSLTATTMEAR